MTLQIQVSGTPSPMTDAEKTDVLTTLGGATTAALSTHTGNTSNPHGVTKAQVGLGNADNTADADKPVSTAQATAIGAAITAHTDATDPHPQYLTPADADTLYAPVSVTGVTNLAATAAPTGVTITSDTGTDATIAGADATNAGAMLPAQVTKLAGIATGATANATDAQLRDRTTHTGAQATSTITGLDTALSGKATTAQGAKADSALQPGSQLTQAAVTGATAAGVALIGAADAAAQRVAMGAMASSLPAMQTAYDAGTTAQQAAFQSSVSGDRARLTATQQAQQTAGATTALLNAGKTALVDPVSGADISLGGGASLFSTPADFGAGIWLSAAAITGLADGASVTTWPDSSGNGLNGTATGAPKYQTKVANGNPGVVFSGASNKVSFPGKTAVKTYMLVFSMDDTQPNYGVILGHSTATDFAGDIAVSSRIVSQTSAPAAKMSSRLTINGRLDCASIGGMPRPTGLTVIIGRVTPGQTVSVDNFPNDRNVAGRYLAGTYAEMALFDTELTDSQVLALSRWACAKYNIAFDSNFASCAIANGLFLGDSITAGLGATIAYPTALQTLIGVSRLNISNLGASGTTAAQWVATNLGTYLYGYQFPRRTGSNDVAHVWLGTNDLRPGTTTAAATYASLKTLWFRLRGVRCKVVAYTILPRNDATGLSATFEADRQALNTLIRSEPHLYDYLVDVGADSTIGAPGAYSNTTYYQADQIHITNAALQIVADLTRPAYPSIVK